MLHDAQLGAKKLVGMFWPWSGAVQNSRKDQRQIVPIATAVSLNHTKEGPTLLQQ
jgi:hypothetical protein